MSGIHPQEFDRPEMWLTYADIRTPTRAHFLDGAPLDELAEALAHLGMHGFAAGFAITTCALDDFARILGRPPQTAVALLGRVPAWADESGRALNAMLSSWVFDRHAEALKWADQAHSQGRGDELAKGLAERMHFAIEAAALLNGRSVPEQFADFDRRFFDHT